jgi:hypothetical protein
MSSVIGNINGLEMDNTIRLNESGEYYEAGNNLTCSRFYQEGNRVVIANGGEEITWVPSGIKYVDEFGMEDLVYTVQDVPVEAKANYVRYNRSMPDIDDWFIQENDSLKHQILVQGFHRDPMPWLSGNIKFAVGGRLSFSENLRVRTDGMVIVGPFTTDKAIDIIDENDRIVFSLPEIVVYDSKVPARNVTAGGYQVALNEGGILEFSVVVDNEWMTSSQQVYPIIIDPTVTVAASVTIGSYSGRTMARLSNGWLVCVASAGTTGGAGQTNFYKSTDKGQTWSQMFSITPSAPSGTDGGFGWTTPRIDVDGNNMLISMILWNYTDGGGSGQEGGDNYVYFLKVDCTTVANSNQWGHASKRGPIITRDSNRSDVTFGGTAIHKGPNGVYHLLAVLSPNGTSFSDSFNRRELLYGSSSDGGNTWTTMLRITSASSSNSITSFDISTNANGIPVVAYTYNGGSSGQAVVASPAIVSGSSPPDFPTWKYKFVLDGIFGVYPYVGGLIRDSDGMMWVFYGSASDSSGTSYLVKVYSSSDSFNTIDGGTIYTGDNKQIMIPNSILDYTGAITAVFLAASNLYTITRPYGGSWGSAVLISSSAGSYNAPAVCDDTRFFGYIQGGALICNWTFINHAPAAPINLTRSNYNATLAATYTWAFSDVNAGDVQAAAEVEIRRVSDGNLISTGKMSGSTQAYSAPANLLVNGQQYQWRVRTWDSYDEVGPWSSYATFWTAASPVVSITNPTSNQVIQTPSTVINWSFSDPGAFPQSQYQVKVFDVSGTTVWDSGLISNPSARSATTGNVLGNGQQYRISVTAYNDKGIASNAAEVWINISYIAPPAPDVVIQPFGLYNRVSITNWASSDPTTQYNDIYRREQGEQDWVRIATQVPISTWQYVSGSFVSEADFIGKVSGSVVENANRFAARGGATALLPPIIDGSANFYESAQSVINNLASINGLYATTVGAANLQLAQQLSSINLIEHLIREYGVATFGPMATVAERITWLKANISKLVGNAWVFGSGPAGNKAYFSVWSNTGNSWFNFGSHALSTVGKLSGSSNSPIASILDNNGFVHYLAYADASNGTIPSTINTDFFNLEVHLAGRNVAVPSSFNDYTVKSGVTYEYKVVAVGSNGAPAESDVETGTVNFSGVILYDVTDPAGTIKSFSYDGGGKSHSWEPESAMMQFQGREAPVVEFGRSEISSITFSIDMKRDKLELNNLISLIKRKAILCYRDGRGEMMFGVISRLPYTDENFGYTSSIEITKVSYNEEV